MFSKCFVPEIYVFSLALELLKSRMLYVSQCLLMCVSITFVQCLQRPEEGPGSQRAVSQHMGPEV